MRTKNVQTDLDQSDVWFIGRQFVKRAEQMLFAGDILISSANSWNLVGKCCWIPELPWQSTFGGFVTVLRANQTKAFPRYLYHWFSSPRIQELARSFGRQTTNISNLDINRCSEIPVPLPPLSEQKRIAEILDAADALRAQRREAIAQLDELIQATFLEMFGLRSRPPISIGPPTFGTADKFVLLRDIARLATGHTPDRNIPEYWGGETPWISLTDIRKLDGAVAESTLQSVTEAGLANSSAVRLPTGTVCFSRTASIGFVTVMGREMSTSQDFVNWVCGPSISPIYLMMALRFSRPYLLEKSTGSTHKTIYYRNAEQFQVHLPPIDQQNRFAAIVGSVEQQKARMRAHLAELDALFASLQSRAFNGEL